MTFNEKKLEELADIEHQRWSDWQRYLHGKCIVNNNGDLIIPIELVVRWERQINTPYKELSEQEKESDRNQVRRYLPIVEQALLDKEQEVLERVYGCINIYDQDNVLLVEEVQDKIVKNIKKEFKQ